MSACQHDVSENQNASQDESLAPSSLEAILDNSSFFKEISTPYEYERFPPNLYNFYSLDKHLMRYIINNIAKPWMSVPSLGVSVFEGGYAADIGMVFNAAGNLVSVSAADQDAKNSIEAMNITDGDIEFIKGGAIFLFKAGKDNFGHLLIEMIPRLELMVAAGLVGVPILVPNLPQKIRDVFEKLVETAYPGYFEIRSMEKPIAKVETLYYPSPITRHNDRKSWPVTHFADRVLAATNSSGPKFDKIYVSRKNHPNRPMANESDIENLFAKNGFSIIDVTGMSIFDQINIFRSASVIAGPMGAALSSIVFAPSNAHVIMLDPGTHDLFFYDLAAFKGQDFSWVFGAAIVMPTLENLHASWTADPLLIESALRSILINRTL